MIDDRDQRIADLENAIKIQAAAVKALEAIEDRELNKLRKQEVEARQALRQLDSEREMNAILTDEIERLRAELDTTRLDERAKIVARLRYWFIDTAANAIEAGEHLK
jgi:hypothetical protein